ncbi:hypothetical protein TNCV_2918961 [Trichonephila clavipes]|nr:hypothetical protein TNCV_2918961 [Trichonephila clavipes]
MRIKRMLIFPPISTLVEKWRPVNRKRFEFAKTESAIAVQRACVPADGSVDIRASWAKNERRSRAELNDTNLQSIGPAKPEISTI